ncbi:MAG: polysaccharide pyruvyl transferase family protein [Thermovirgaceae bacterium]
MFIEIKGAEFVNRGAELMLRAILQRLRPEFPGACFVLAPWLGRDNKKKREELGLYKKIWFPSKWGIQPGYLGNLVPEKLRRIRGFVVHNEISVALDSSGFAYTDQMGEDKTLDMAKAAKRWGKLGTSVVLLPQAFGPFSSRKIRSAFRTIAENSEYIFPRDDVSYRYVTELAGESPRIIQVPDFTIGVRGVVPEIFPEGRVAIVPNRHMIGKTSREESSRYVPFLVSCIRTLVSAGEKPFFLIHEDKGDLEIAEKINAEFDPGLYIYQEEDPLRLKGTIGRCKGMIGSRFHGLVSALSQGIPAFAVGWSHKYEALYRDFNFREGMLSLDLEGRELEDRLKPLLDPCSGKELSVRLESAKEENMIKVEKMWELVIGLIRSKTG